MIEAILCGIYESAKNGKEVKIKLENIKIILVKTWVIFCVWEVFFTKFLLTIILICDIIMQSMKISCKKDLEEQSNAKRYSKMV